MRHPNLLSCAALAVALACSPAVPAAPPEGKGPQGKPGSASGRHGGGSGGWHEGKGGGPDKKGASAGELRRAGISFEVAHGYAQQYGAVGYQPLPPGIRKNLSRGKPLPPGIARKGVPPAVLARLPVYPGYGWSVIGSDLVLVALATGIVADVLIGVFD